MLVQATCAVRRHFLRLGGVLGGFLAIWRMMRSSVFGLVSTPASRAASSKRRDCSAWDTALRLRAMFPQIYAFERSNRYSKHDSSIAGGWPHLPWARGSRRGLTPAVTGLGYAVRR
jgi:hypothetical protein